MKHKQQLNEKIQKTQPLNQMNFKPPLINGAIFDNKENMTKLQSYGLNHEKKMKL